MPIRFLRDISGKDRSQPSNRRLGLSLAFVAGATNAGGFLAVQQYTSHMTGIVSHMADELAVGDIATVTTGLGGLLCFLGGAATTAALVNWARRQNLHSAYAAPLMLEAALLLLFGLLGHAFVDRNWMFVPATVALLCYIMGLQNALITKASNYEIRTTHVTGIVTDLGIELGKLFYWNVATHEHRVLANRPKLRLLGGLLAMFFVGGVAGALGFKRIGFVTTVPLALIVSLLAVVPIVDDLRNRLR
ncbi:DUF1275 domain-containing protein [Cupriavidus respiraculi]|uniref:YoaK family protein n=1 Tax=Cupriavidus respiraculi TaxID=195930 RepID=UPI001C954FC2|nr:YoaK family protein [Cupriavidus respiraculi]MBY4945682.1 DUF1275 domain-containing protein [Cupriavidus respiraculi]